MDSYQVLAFSLLVKIEDEFKQFSGSNEAFAHKILHQYGLRVHFLHTANGVVHSINYDDLMLFFENMDQQLSWQQGPQLPNSWQDGQ